MKRVVIDTNVFVSSVLGGALSPILDHWRADKHLLALKSYREVAIITAREFLEQLKA